MIKAGIVGVSGYSGIELFHILSMHPDVEIIAISSRTYDGEKLGEIYPHLSHIDKICKEYSPEELADLCDVIFTAVPHGGPAMEYAIPIKQANKKLIDLSADFRIKDKEIYEAWYNVEHTQSKLLTEAVYGLPELHREEIKKAWLIANPGCYTTAAILSIAPLIKNEIIDESSIIIDAKSGASGAGRKIKQNLHFPELDEGIQAYAVGKHRHIPEIEQELTLLAKKNVSITFVPHLVPMIRGILSVSYLNVKMGRNRLLQEEIIEVYKNFYHTHPFVRVLGRNLPNTKYTAGTNYIDIAIQTDEKNNRIIILSAIDNLIKGASGQAVQNMNLAFGLKEDTGLKFKPIYP
ncbi:MAG: N-acetyl-gamma-glutamyl-phosphate reductase [Spirochaetes bacterium]|nr:N-acetyl-gamma-glutamyl-phosphate reductase [Spirochaetota bacterium]